MIAPGVRIGPIPGDAVLGRHHEPVSPTLEQLPQDRLALPASVVAGRVDDIAAGLGVGVDDATALPQRRTHAALFAKGHGPQEEPRDPQPGAAKRPIAHCSSSQTMYWSCRAYR